MLCSISREIPKQREGDWILVNTLSGPSSAATCLAFKTPPAASLRRHSTDIYFLDLQNSIPLSLLWNFPEH